MGTVADQFAETLAAAGVKRIYGIVGAIDAGGLVQGRQRLYRRHRARFDRHGLPQGNRLSPW
jgi:hypothetical protein